MNTEIDISRVGQDGQGVGYDPEKNIYFVPNALPGDRVKISFHQTKRYRDAVLEEIVSPSRDRRSPECGAFGECGGCDWLNWEYDSQLKAKEETLTHILDRFGLTPKNRLPIIAAQETLNYRNRVQVRRQGEKIGFYKKGTHDVVDIENCAVTDKRLNDQIARLREEPSPETEEKIELFLTEEGKVSFIRNASHGALGFTQVHSSQNSRLRDMVKAGFGTIKPKGMLELFCGNGNLSRALIPSLDRYFGIDGNRAAIDEGTKWLGLETNKEFACAELSPKRRPKLPKWIEGNYELLLLDPPRLGVGRAIEPFLHSDLQGILYVSCSPKNFTFDAKRILDAGFSVDSVQAIDMFPQTRHIEFVTLFVRS